MMRFQPMMPLWLLLPLLILVLAAVGWQLYVTYRQDKTMFLRWVRRTGLAVALFLMAAGPSIPGGVSSPGVANLDVLFVVDTTASMGAVDYQGNRLRLEGVKEDMKALGDKLRGAHLSIVTFDSKVNTILPSTSDATTFSSTVETLHREVQGTSKGSAIDKPIERIIKLLKDSSTRHPERDRLVFYLGDGEQTNEEEVKSFKTIDRYVVGGAVLGYGTAKGAKMLKYDGVGEETSNGEYVKTIDPATKKFVPAVSKLDEDKLNTIARELGVAYQNRNRGGQFDDLFRVSNVQVLIDKKKQVVHYLNLYWLFAIPLVILIFWEWKTLFFLMLQLKKEQGAGRV